MPARLSVAVDAAGPYSVVYMYQRADDDAGTGYGAPVLPVLPRLTEEERRRAVLLHVFPTGLVSIYPDHMEFYRVCPEGPALTRLEKLLCVPPAARARPTFEAEMRRIVTGFEEIRDEDVAVCLAVQRGLASRLAGPAPLCYLEEPIRRFARWVEARLAAPATPPGEPGARPRRRAARPSARPRRRGPSR